jgi:hypothetical protein
MAQMKNPWKVVVPNRHTVPAHKFPATQHCVSSTNRLADTAAIQQNSWIAPVLPPVPVARRESATVPSDPV